MFRSFVPAEPKRKRSAATLAAGIEAEPHSDEGSSDKGSIGPPAKLVRQTNERNPLDDYIDTCYKVVNGLKTLAEEQGNKCAVQDIEKLLKYMYFLAPGQFYKEVFANPDPDAKYKSIFVICTTYFTEGGDGYQKSVELYEEARQAAKSLYAGRR